MNNRPTDAEFWDQRYRAKRTPWDAGGVPAALTRFLARHPGHGSRVLIPGCGSGYEVAAFAAAGYDVRAIDISPVAIAQSQGRVPAVLRPHIMKRDFFDRTPDLGMFDLIYERTFLCALPPSLWLDIASRTAELLRSSGQVVGIYYFGPKDNGPPFGCADGEPDSIFADYLRRTHDEPVPAHESLPMFSGAERWQERTRAAA